MRLRRRGRVPISARIAPARPEHGAPGNWVRYSALSGAQLERVLVWQGDPVADPKPVLVTGAFGLVGTAVVQPSIAVYGARNPHRLNDVLTPDTPLTPSDIYGSHKVEAEHIVRTSTL